MGGLRCWLSSLNISESLIQGKYESWIWPVQLLQQNMCSLRMHCALREVWPCMDHRLNPNSPHLLLPASVCQASCCCALPGHQTFSLLPITKLPSQHQHLRERSHLMIPAVCCCWILHWQKERSWETFSRSAFLLTLNYCGPSSTYVSRFEVCELLCRSISSCGGVRLKPESGGWQLVPTE